MQPLFERLDRCEVGPDAYLAAKQIPLSVIWNLDTQDYTLLHGYAAFDGLDSKDNVLVTVYRVDTEEEKLLIVSLLHNREELSYWAAVEVLLLYKDNHLSNQIICRLTGWKTSTVKRHYQIINDLDTSSIHEAESHNVKLTTWGLVQQIVQAGRSGGYAFEVRVLELERRSQNELRTLLRFIKLPEFLSLNVSDKIDAFQKAVSMVHSQHNVRVIGEALNIIFITNTERTERFFSALQNLTALYQNVDWNSVSKDEILSIKAYFQQIMDGLRSDAMVLGGL